MLNAYQLKLLAFGFMVVDHVGRLFFPQAHFMVALGRLSFPLFAYLIATGEQHTKNLKNYLLRLVFLGILTQPFYNQYSRLISQQKPPLNILFGLALGVATIRVMKAIKNPLQKVSIVMLSSMIATSTSIEGSFNTILTIVLISMFQNKFIWWSSYILLTVYFVITWKLPLSTFFCLCAPILISFYNGKQGKKSRLFYLIYPAHFFILLILNRVFMYV